MTDSYSASVVGAGTGGRLSLKALAASERYELVAACDMRAEVCREIEEMYPGIRTFTSHKEMLAECPTEVVCVSTWAPSHREITLDALKLPLKGILVEKPLGDTAEAGAEILEHIKGRNLPMVVPHNMIVDGCGKDIIAKCKHGAVGDLRLVEIECDKWDIINAGIQWINYFITLTGNEPIDHVLAACDCSTRTYRDGMQVETEGVTYVVTESGIRCVQQTGDYISIMDHGECTIFRIMGTQGFIEYAFGEPSYKLLNPEYPEGVFIAPEPEAAINKHQIYLENMTVNMDNGTTDYRVPESSLMSLQACEAAYLSSRYRCAVSFPLDTFTPPAPPDWDPGMPYSGKGGGRDGRKLKQKGK